jgi:DNA-binding NarL/FixJ family response regulator
MVAERTAETHGLHIYHKMGVENCYTATATLSRLAAAVWHHGDTAGFQRQFFEVSG